MHHDEQHEKEEQEIGSAAPSDESKEVGENAEVPEGEGYEADPDRDADGSGTTSTNDSEDTDAEDS